MSNYRSGLAYPILVTFGILGAWLIGLFEGRQHTSEITSNFDVLLSLLGFFILLGAIAGVVVVISRERQPMTKEQGLLWKQVKIKGRRFYIQNFVMKSALPLIFVFSLLIVKDYWTIGTIVDALKIYGILAVVFIGGLIYAAIRTWDYYEYECSQLLSKIEDGE